MVMTGNYQIWLKIIAYGFINCENMQKIKFFLGYNVHIYLNYFMFAS